jgi:hypothetical protein
MMMKHFKEREVETKKGLVVKNLFYSKHFEIEIENITTVQLYLDQLQKNTQYVEHALT